MDYLLLHGSKYNLPQSVLKTPFKVIVFIHASLPGYIILLVKLKIHMYLTFDMFQIKIKVFPVQH